MMLRQTTAGKGALDETDQCAMFAPSSRRRKLCGGPAGQRHDAAAQRW
jgi:hypothetical protein